MYTRGNFAPCTFSELPPSSSTLNCYQIVFWHEIYISNVLIDWYGSNQPFFTEISCSKKHSFEKGVDMIQKVHYYNYSNMITVKDGINCNNRTKHRREKQEILNVEKRRACI